MIGPDQHHIAEAVRDQFHPAQDVGTHDDLAQLAVGLHQRQQLFAVQLDHFARRAGAGMVERATAGQHLDLAAELARPMDRDQGLAASAGRMISIWPCVTRKNGMASEPASNSTSPARIARLCPCAATRAICAGVRVGNNWATRAERVSAAAGTAASLMAVCASSVCLVRVHFRLDACSGFGARASCPRPRNTTTNQ